MNKLTLNLLILLTIPCILYGRNFNVMDFGARGNGISDDAIAIQKAVDACTNAGGGDVVFSANHTFLSGPVQLKSNVNIVLETNSVWKANPDESIYHLSAFGKNEGEGMMWIWAKDVEKVREIREDAQISVPEDEMIRRESAAQLRTMVDDLPGQRSKILKMSKLDELSNREIAERLGLSVRTVEKHLELALKDLRGKLN